MKDLHLKVEKVEGQTLTILTGEAEVKSLPQGIIIAGIITSPGNYIQKRITEIDKLKSHLLVDREQMTLCLFLNENDKEMRTSITGKLEFHPDFKKFKINSGATWSSFELADFIKMNRSYFSSKEVAAKLVKQLREFKAKVNKEVEQKTDDRANYEMKLSQAVNSNLPENFTISVPIFKGQNPQQLLIEINIHPTTLECQLCSPDANDIVESYKDSVINTELERIEKIFPELLVIEQ